MSELQELKKDVQEIMRNHLPHIQESLTKHEERLRLLLWVLGLVGAIVIADFLKSF